MRARVRACVCVCTRMRDTCVSGWGGIFLQMIHFTRISHCYTHYRIVPSQQPSEEGTSIFSLTTA